jgi:hypothetical protein
MYKLEVAKIEQWLFLLEYQFKNLDFVDILKKEIDNKVGILDYKTNVKGQMTKFDEFINNQIFNNLLKECLYFSNVLNIKDSRLTCAWGNILKKGGEVKLHKHNPAIISGVLYLTEGGPGTYFPEFNKTVEEKIGKIVFFSGSSIHQVLPYTLNKNRYTIAFNLNEIKPWENETK